jgi:hypothetical protein
MLTRKRLALREIPSFTSAAERFSDPEGFGGETGETGVNAEIGNDGTPLPTQHYSGPIFTNGD